MFTLFVRNERRIPNVSSWSIFSHAATKYHQTTQLIHQIKRDFSQLLESNAGTCSFWLEPGGGQQWSVAEIKSFNCLGLLIQDEGQDLKKLLRTEAKKINLSGAPSTVQSNRPGRKLASHASRNHRPTNTRPCCCCCGARRKLAAQMHINK